MKSQYPRWWPYRLDITIDSLGHTKNCRSPVYAHVHTVNLLRWYCDTCGTDGNTFPFHTSISILKGIIFHAEVLIGEHQPGAGKVR